MTVKEFTIIVENLLARGETETALTLLKTFSDSKDDELRHQIVLLSGQYYDIIQNQQLGLGNDPIKINRINHTLISLNTHIAKSFGDEVVISPVQAALSSVKTGSIIKQKNNLMLWLKISGGLCFIALLVYFLAPKKQQDKPTAESHKSPTENNVLSEPFVAPDTAHSAQILVSSTGHTAQRTPLEGEEGIHINAKAQFKDLELLETIYWADAGKLILHFKYHCAYDNTGGCGVLDKNFAFKIGNKEYTPTAARINGVASSIISPNSDGIVVFETDKIPRGTQKVEFKVGENFMAVSEILKNPMTIPIDLTQKTEFKKKPIVINLNTEKTLLSDKILGSVRLYSLTAQPESDTHIKLKAHILKKSSDDFYHKCIRVIADKTWYCQANIKELARLSNGIEVEATFLVPRTAQSLELMLEKCQTKNAIKIPINFF